jgi:hypothetical protein
VVVEGLDPANTTRVLLLYPPARLGAAFDIAPETPDGPVEVRLQPTATIVGQFVTSDGRPAENGHASLAMDFDTKTIQFTTNRLASYPYYENFLDLLPRMPPRAGSEFALGYVVPGVPFGLRVGRMVEAGGWEDIDIITVTALQPGERRDLGKIVLKADAREGQRMQVLLQLAKRIGVVPNLWEAGNDGNLGFLVVPGSPAAKAGMRSGDQLSAVNGRSVQNLLDLMKVERMADLDKPLRLTLLRAGKPVEVTLPAETFEGLFGPKPKPLGNDLFEVTFSYRPSQSVKQVYLAGTFNDWKPTAHKMEGPDKDGRFTTRLQLKRGTYEYKFVLEGKTWEADPENVLQAGAYRNSLVFVAGKP